MKKILIIQTAFIGDVVLGLPVAQRLHTLYPEAEIHFLVRKGNEGLLANHPAISRIWIWQKGKGKFRNLLRLSRELRAHHFDLALNLHRFGSSGFLMWRLKANEKRGFDKNPFAFSYDQKIPHLIPHPDFKSGQGHEVNRNLQLVEPQPPPTLRPQLYPSPEDYAQVAAYTAQKPYLVLAPASVWYTKQWHPDQWKKLLALIPETYTVYLIGGPADKEFCEQFVTHHPQAVNLCGKLSLLQSAALMRDAQRVIVNDSAPQHFASAMNAPTTTIFCSTVPEFGFGPLSEDAVVVETPEALECRPCGLHGHKACPVGHFACAFSIDPERVWETVG